MRPKGFTLVEVLLSISIFSIVAVAVFRVFSAAVYADQRVDRSLKSSVGILSAVHALELDLQNVALYRRSDQSFPLEGDAGSLSLVTSHNDELLLIRYWLDDNGNLRRSSQSVAGSSNQGQAVFSPAELRDVTFSFGYLKADDKEKIIWKDSWHRATLPFAVRWKAELRRGPESDHFLTIERTIVIPRGPWGFNE